MLAEREVLEDQFMMSAAGQRYGADKYSDRLQHASILSFLRRGWSGHANERAGDPLAPVILALIEEGFDKEAAGITRDRDQADDQSRALSSSRVRGPPKWVFSAALPQCHSTERIALARGEGFSSPYFNGREGVT